MKKTIFAVIGFLLILGALGGGNILQLANWSTAELIGFNVMTLVELIIGGYLVYWGLIKKHQKTELRSNNEVGNKSDATTRDSIKIKS
jgi:hypothetical protein